MMVTKKLLGYVYQDDLIDHNLKTLKVKKGKIDFWLINPGSNYSEVTLEFKQPDVLHQVSDTQINKLIKLLGFSPDTGIGKSARQEIFGNTSTPVDLPEDSDDGEHQI